MTGMDSLRGSLCTTRIGGLVIRSFIFEGNLEQLTPFQYLSIVLQFPRVWHRSERVTGFCDRVYTTQLPVYQLPTNYTRAPTRDPD